MRVKRVALAIWLIVLAGCAVIVARAPLRTDMAAFLPHSSSVAQEALTEQVNHGAASHLIILALTGAPPAMLAALSQDVAARLRQEPGFVDILNGDDHSFAGVQRFIWDNRYLLSPGVTAKGFTVAGLHAALQGDLGLLDSDMGSALQGSLPGDPTGAALTLMTQMHPGQGPRSLDGVWFSADGSRALLLVHTAAPGFDIDGQQQALMRIGAAFDAARAALPGAAAARLLETGPGVFAVRIRDTTKRDVTRLSLLATVGAMCLLMFAYRSVRVLVLGLLPVVSGVIIAIAAVSMDFGFVHGVTLGFGVTLIGESLDYPIYLFTQTTPGESASATLGRIWPVLRLGAATSVVGFSAMLGSAFVGFAQLGLFSIVGLIAAVCVTRFVLPHLVPKGFFAPGGNALAAPLLGVMKFRAGLRVPIGIVVLASIAALMLHHGGLWDGDLGKLSPIPPREQALDTELRRDLGVADQRYFAVFRTRDEQAALRQSEALGGVLQDLVTQRALTGFDVPSATLPSVRTQDMRRAALPDDAQLHARLQQAMAGLPFRADAFAPFFAAVSQARKAPDLIPANLPPALALRLQSMLVPSDGGWTVLAPLRDVSNPAGVRAAFAAAGLPGLQFVDLDHESGQLLRIFQRDATGLAVFGSLGILLVLLLGLRSPRRVAAVAAPLAASVIVTAALLTMDGGKLSIFMVVGFLMIIAVGSNYCLFFERGAAETGARRRAVASIVLANLCTVSAYGLMSVSHIPVLHDIGMTVALGTFLSLFFGAVLSAPQPPPQPQA